MVCTTDNVRPYIVSCAVLIDMLCPVVWGKEPDVKQLRPGRFSVTFFFETTEPVRTVHVAGNFNGWSSSETALADIDGKGHSWAVSAELAPGRYEYKFVLNHTHWESDPANRLQTGPYGNSLVYVGVEPQEVPDDEVGRLSAEALPGAWAEHPLAVVEFLQHVREADSSERALMIENWMSHHPMPHYSESAVTFILFSPLASILGARELDLVISAVGQATAHTMHRPLSDVPLFVLTVNQAALPPEATYLFAVVSGTPKRRRQIVDPYAWSVSSRAGRPVGMVTRPDKEKGRIELIPKVQPAKGSMRRRDLYVYLPPGYGSGGHRRFPVLYMHDGQNCWDDPVHPFGHGGWQVNRIADRLIHEGLVEPFIVVGIPNTPERQLEYGPGEDIFSADGHTYLQFLIDTAKPTIDSRYPTRLGPEDTALMGSSMGGNISLQAALLRPDIFGAVGCLSPALQFKDRHDQGYFDLLEKIGRVPVKIYLDSGTAGRGQDGAPLTRRLGEALIQQGWREGHDLLRFEDAGAEHNERAWRARVFRPLTFFFAVNENEAASSSVIMPTTQPIP